jgi:hypothetical protein
VQENIKAQETNIARVGVHATVMSAEQAGWGAAARQSSARCHLHWNDDDATPLKASMQEVERDEPAIIFIRAERCPRLSGPSC